MIWTDNNSGTYDLHVDRCEIKIAYDGSNLHQSDVARVGGGGVDYYGTMEIVVQ